MKKEEITVLCGVVIAFSTFVGVGAAIAYYMQQIQDFQIGYIILTEIIYILIMGLVIFWIKSELKRK